MLITEVQFKKIRIETIKIQKLNVKIKKINYFKNIKCIFRIHRKCLINNYGMV